MMTHWNDIFREGLSVAQSFLSTLLKESITLSEEDRSLFTASELKEPEDKTRVSILLQDPERGELLVQLDEAWLPVLSSRMMGIEETALNEVSRDLIQRFAGELKTTVQDALLRAGIEVEPENVELVTASRYFNSPKRDRYLCITLHANGFGENTLLATIWLGSNHLPETLEELTLDAAQDSEEPETDGENRTVSSDVNKPDQRSATDKGSPMSEEENEFKSMNPDELASSKGSRESVISGRHIQFEEFEDEDLSPEKGARGLELLKDIEMDLSVELGRIELPLGKVLELTRGSVIELERLAGEPVDILVNGHKIAYGEVVVIDEHFGVRISNLITTRQKMVELQ
ncbi:MAG: flagellar motor switch protein FliN [Balneolaceae bacterium]